MIDDEVWARLDPTTVADGRSFPVTIPPGERAVFVLGIDVTDCETARAATPDLVADAGGWWGSGATTVSRPDDVEPDFGFHLSSLCAG